MYKASAPGKLFLLGEHAVLHGHPAILTAVDQSIRVQLTPRRDERIVIASALGHHETSCTSITIQKPFQFVLSALKSVELPSGCDIKITADFSDQMGFGSSAAVTVATLKAVQQWLGGTVPFSMAKQVMQAAQEGIGSGADIAVALQGGTIYFDPQTATITSLAHKPPLMIRYAGYKTKTVEVIKQVNERFKNRPAYFTKLCEQMGQLSIAAVPLIQAADWQGLGKLFNQGQEIMRELGVSDATLEKLIAELLKTPGVYGAKISGSGLGDCVIAI